MMTLFIAKRSWLLGALLPLLAGCGGQPSGEPQTREAAQKEVAPDPCANNGTVMGPEVPSQKYQRPASCTPLLATNHTPNGRLGTKIFTIRDEETFQRRYSCTDAAGQKTPSGIDFTKHRLILFYRDHSLTDTYQPLFVRDNSQAVLLGYRLERCRGEASRQYTLDVDELLLPAEGRQVRHYWCAVDKGPCPASP